MSNDALKDLHTAIVDAREGYATAIKDADDGTIRAVFQEMDALHASAHSEIHRALAAKGETADDSGSFMGTVHKTVISVRSAITGLDKNSLDAFADGEKMLVGKYDDAIREQMDAATKTALEAQRTKLQQKVDQLKAMTNDAKSDNA